MAINSYNITIQKYNRVLVQIKDFRIEQDHITLLFGESGIGKSLIAKSIFGILDPEEFNIEFNKQPYSKYTNSACLKEVRENGFFVFQEPSTHLNPLMSIKEQLDEGEIAQRFRKSKILQKLWNTDDKDVIDKIIEVFPKPYRPSGGEKQRILLAMAFLKLELFLQKNLQNANSLFVFDEFSSSLDNYYRDIFLSILFTEFKKRKFTVMLITHDYSIISSVNKFGENITTNVSYMELSLRKKGLVLEKFNPELYLNWLKEQKDKVIPKRKSLQKKPILNVCSGIEVFGRKIVLSKDPYGASPCQLEIYPNSVTYIKAPSGSGKTTFIKSVMGLIPVKNLKVALKDINLSERTQKRYWQKYVWGRMMSMTFQHADEALNQDSTVKGTLKGLPKKIDNDAICSVIGELFDIEIDQSFLNKKVKYLSGGQKQKLNLLRSLVLDTDLLILDEPFNGLDFESIRKVLSIIIEKQRVGKGILIISHNEEILDTIVPVENIYYLHSYEI
jgi:peptide/nickel transport system ATP-binding protein